MSERRLLVLYQGEKGQDWCLYAGGESEASEELELMRKEDPELVVKAQIWITTSAEVVWSAL